MVQPLIDLEKKNEITKSLIEAMRNYPPLKKEIEQILTAIKEAYPEYKALIDTKSIKKGRLTLTEWEVLPTLAMFKTVEKRLQVKPYTDERGKDAFANLLWLAFVLFYLDDLQNMLQE